jgi:hypothetical protein
LCAGGLDWCFLLQRPGLESHGGLAPVAHDPYLSGVTAGRYFAVTRAHGTPAFSSADQIAASPLPQREAAD